MTCICAVLQTHPLETVEVESLLFPGCDWLLEPTAAFWAAASLGVLGLSISNKVLTFSLKLDLRGELKTCWEKKKEERNVCQQIMLCQCEFQGGGVAVESACVPLSVCWGAEGVPTVHPGSAASNGLPPITGLKWKRSKQEHLKRINGGITTKREPLHEERCDYLTVRLGALQTGQRRQHVRLGRVRSIRMFLLRDFVERRHAEQKRGDFRSTIISKKQKKDLFIPFWQTLGGWTSNDFSNNHRSLTALKTEQKKNP